MAKARTDTLEAALQNLFTGGDTTRVSWFALTGGEQLFGEGDPADTLYLVRSGRLGVFCHDGDHTPRFLGVVRPGEPVGEMSMLAGTPHTASVVALRDSEILALPRETFFEAARSQPDLMVELSRLMIRRSRDKTLGGSEPSVFGFISARPKPIRAFVERIAACIEADGFTCQIIDHSALTSVTDWFSRVEDSHDFVLYVAEADEPAWAQLCTRQVDRLFIVGNPLTTPPGANLPRNPALDAQQRTDLILLRDPRMPRPANTSIWLDAVKPGRWFHAMDGHDGDAARLARIVTGTAVGVVLSGGGARAYAHIGALKALRDAKVPLDFLGGASMGAVIAAGPALGWSHDELEDEIKRAFVASDPLSDITFPLIAMTRAGKVARLLRNAYGETDIADMPLPFFAVSTNLTTGRIEVHKRGLLRRAMRATISIPGVMPPVVMHDQVLVDGAVLRNFPAETMRQMNAGPVVGVDMSQARGVDPASLQNPPSWWRWILSGDWKNGPPIVAVLMRAATLTSDADVETSRKATDLLIQPEPEGMDIRDWKAYDIPVQAGYEAARAALAELDVPVTRLRRERSRQAEAAETVEAPEPPAKRRGRKQGA
ncbi:patatin-like phospholipase family protein [Brevundimonas sp. A19_0]|uniref:patatin-like phospholipase family protein n=1 Tax=Brevundimonas sp. A19_0 TaxID=2821087 RepID=UPI001ADB66F5|nr:patatin-like phospholipase family protein [Brevundimonas sp. A19_0]MBO9502634.1 patatin-like phospholipase family protein [Brevundimonas sp. A19_0]